MMKIKHVINEDFLEKEYNVPSQKKMDAAFEEYKKMENVSAEIVN